MQSEEGFASQWPGGGGSGGDGSSVSNMMSATSGPVEHFYWHGRSTPTPSASELRPPPPPATETARSNSRPPPPPQPQSGLSPAAHHTLSTAKSTPVFLPSRPLGSVKNIANKFDQAGTGAPQPPQLTVRTSHDRYRRPVGAKSPRSPLSPTKEGIRKLQRSPPKDPVKLQKRRPKSPVKSPATSFETSSSFGSATTIASAKSQPHAAFSPKQQYLNTRPLFGEITSDGQWNGNFDLRNYGALPHFSETPRRSSDGNVAFNHGRSRSHQEMLQPSSANALSPPKQHTLSHKRSRSEMDAFSTPQPSSIPNIHPQIPGAYPTPPNSTPRSPLNREGSASRIPVSNRRQSQSSASSGPHSRSASALANPAAARNRLSKSPTRKNVSNGPAENSNPTSFSRSRYHPQNLPTEQGGQTLSAKIVAPLPKTSPPLRSSRPRQPVSAATTSASRARAAERYHGPVTRDGRRPSEQWLGKPYDPQQERSKRKIPELGKIDFEARRERIQKAISQNLEEQRSLESLRAKSRSRQPSQEQERQAAVGAGAPVLDAVDQQQAEEMNRETDSMPGGWPTPGGLSVDTFSFFGGRAQEPDPTSAQTEFELDESPTLGRPATQENKEVRELQAEPPVLLTSARYQRSPARAPAPLPFSPVQEAPAEEVQSPSVLENVMRMRQRSSSQASRSGTDDDGDDIAPASTEQSPGDLEEKWGLGNGLYSAQGSIRIMLGDNASSQPQAGRSWSRSVHEELDHINPRDYEGDDLNVQQANVFAANGYTDSPVEDRSAFQRSQPQKLELQDPSRDDTLRAGDFPPPTAFTAAAHGAASDPTIARALQQYQSEGTIAPDMLKEMQKHMVDLQRMSANEGSNGFMIQSLLDSILDVQNRQREHEEQSAEVLPSTSYQMPEVTPDTPEGWEYEDQPGTAVVYSNHASYQLGPEDEENGMEDFHVRIRKADEEWERQQRGEYLRLETDDDKPPPPPKDIGYTPRSSIGPSSATLPPELSQGLRISTMDQESGQDDRPGVDEEENTPMQPEPSSSAPPYPDHAPPPPPPPPAASAMRSPFDMPEPPPIPATYSERGSSEFSPRARKSIWGQSGSSRPSVDSQRAPGSNVLPGSVSMTSFTESTRQDSMDAGADGQSRLAKSTSPNPEQKRLLRRRHIIKELLDTENTYHQDLKIIEDIYKATALPDLLSPEDKKILFGNCDEVERFSLHFYDDLRKAVAPVYVPAKQMRWMNKRGSYSTTQSEGTTQTSIMSTDSVDDERDRSTTVGQAFLQSLQRMEQVYSCYLKNHDAANQRLSALRNTSTVKCWLDECHNNASDITSAWDLDSLLVKPTQRISKYPMLLQQLLETTPPTHPDREALSTACRDSISMLTRINEAKKRAELVDQIVNRKRKDSDVRSGIAKAFGRRTEKLKERVGIAEAFQDPDFDQLSHKYGGHYIRLQICMRDVQGYMHRIREAMDQITNYTNALDLFTDVSMSSGSELESKWRKYGQAVRELTSIAFADHRAAVQKRVIDPMNACIKLNEGAEHAIKDRKKRIVDYAKCKAIEKRGEKPDKKAIEASELYEALNDQLKVELPKLYSLTASLVQGCLNCFLDIQLTWYNTWERKLRPVLEAADIPTSIAQIEPVFRQDYDLIKNQAMELGICNGAALAESANFLSPSFTNPDSEPSSAKRPSTLDSSKRTMSMNSDSFPLPGSAGHKRRSSSFAPGTGLTSSANDTRMRSTSSLSQTERSTQVTASNMMANRPWSNSNTPTTSSFSLNRPATAHVTSSQQAVYLQPRSSAEHARSPRITSGATYFTARPEPDRFSGIFNSAMPPDTPDVSRPETPKAVPDDMQVLFVCASLFEFSIDKTRKEAGYPYLTYVQGEVFDVIAQKGELWLAKNQDDATNSLGWIWEQHFVILSQD